MVTKGALMAAKAATGMRLVDDRLRDVTPRIHHVVVFPDVICAGVMLSAVSIERLGAIVRT